MSDRSNSNPDGGAPTPYPVKASQPADQIITTAEEFIATELLRLSSEEVSDDDTNS